MFASKHADMDTIAGSLCAYMLLGYLWAVLYSMIEAVQPGAFRLLDESERMVFEGESSIVSIYFSFVTLTTPGYGDVTPVTPIARTSGDA
ncbi:MAG: two pore domain potassium channel family protein [bacterium]|nr:two pore domain potassium channel family protein [bacterium]